MSKVYIGSGKKHATYDVVNVNICLDDAKQFIFKSEKSGKMYLSFDVSSKKEKDQYGNTHACSIWVKEEQPPVPEPTAADHGFSDDDIPF